MFETTTSRLRTLFFLAALAPVALCQTYPGPVTFSVNGSVDSHTDGLGRPRGAPIGAGAYNFTRMPTPVLPATGIDSPMRPGDVNDYLLFPMSSQAELFQSEPDPLPAAPPSGTNNQILVADELGLVAGYAGDPYHDNINGVSFGEDFFGVTSCSAYVSTNTWQAWHMRVGGFVEPMVTGDSGTSFRLTPDPWAIGLPGTDLRVQAGPADLSPFGFWGSPLWAAGDVFSTPILTLPGAPLAGTNTLVFDQVSLGLLATGLAPIVGGGYEDDLDALECVGSNDPTTWLSALPGVVTQAGNLRSRLASYGYLGSPGVSTHYFYNAPVFFTVDRNSTGAALSAVRTQYLGLGPGMPGGPEAAGDVFMAFSEFGCFSAVGCGTNYLLIDETEAGLFGGGGGPSAPPDDMDALILNVHPDDRYMMIELVRYHLPYGYHYSTTMPWQVVQVVDPDGIPGSGDEYRTGPGFSYSLLRFFWEEFGYVPRMQLGFSVTTDSVGTYGTAVDFEAGLKPTMEQAGDIFYTHFGSWPWPGTGVVNPEPFASGTNYLWYQETQIGLDKGAWIPGVSVNLALLPDELNGLDSTDGYVTPSDSCATAVPIAEGVVITSSNITATSGPDPLGACGAMANDVWFTFVAACTATYNVTTCVVGTNYDTVVAVWDGSFGCGGAPLACNDDSCTLPGQILSSTTTFAATAGTTYYVSVGGFAGATGTFKLLVARNSTMTLAFTSAGPGSLGYTVTGGPSGGGVFTALTTNAGVFPAGWLFGVDITLAELSSELTTGFPFITTLSPCGTVAVGPFPGLPTGLTVYGVSMGYPIGSPHGAPASGTVP